MKRRDKGLSQTQLAALASISQTALANYEMGKRRPSLDASLQLAHALGVSLGWLFPLDSAERPDETDTAQLAEFLDRTDDIDWKDSANHNAEYGRFVDGVLLNIEAVEAGSVRLPIILRSIRRYWSTVLLTLTDLPLAQRVDIAVEGDRLRRVERLQEIARKDEEIHRLRLKVAALDKTRAKD